MSYTRLKKAPINHFSKEFLDYLRTDDAGRVVVIYEDIAWLVIENCKYHKKDSPWFTAFYKLAPHDPWQGHLNPLIEIWGDWKWVKKASSKQTIRRFHIHLIKE